MLELRMKKVLAYLGRNTKAQFGVAATLCMLIILPVVVLSMQHDQNLFSMAASASYTAGITTKGATMDSGNQNGISATQVTTGAVPGTLNSISVYVGKVNNAPSNHMQVAIYADNGAGVPGSLLTSSASQVVSANAWNTFTLANVAIAGNTKYWLAFNVDGKTTQYALAKNNQGNSVWKIPTAYGTWTNPFGSSTDHSTEQYSIYMTYTSVTTPTPTVIPTPVVPTSIPTAVPTSIPTTTPGMPTPTSTVGARDPLKQPFASNSIWNMPIGSGAVYVAANLPAVPEGDVWAPMPQIDDERIVLTPNAPLTVINFSDAAWSGKNRCNATTGGSWSGLPVSVPMPSNFIVGNDNQNEPATFLKADGRTIFETAPFTRCTAGGPATSFDATHSLVDLYGPGTTGAHGGSGLSVLGGSIRVGELRPGQQGPKHAIKVEVDSPYVLYPCKVETDCYRWPAITSDSGSVGDYGSHNTSPNPAMKMGSLLAIPASVNIASMGLETEPGRQLAWTLQNYGAYIVDSTGGASFQLDTESGPNGSLRTQFQADYGLPLEQRVNDNTAWSRDMQRLVTSLYVVNNNSATSIGGGGAPRQPLAPEIHP
jgi:hypothetical protein